MSDEERQIIDEALEKVIEDYGETLRLLSD